MGEVKTRDLVLIGGGHSHIEVLRSLARDPVAGLRTTIVSRELQVPYSGMLPGYVAGHYARNDLHIDLAPLAAAAGARLIAGTVSQIDTGVRTISCDGRPPLRYDVASINCGAAPALSDIRNADRFGVSVKPIGQFIPRWHQLLERMRDHGRPRFQLAIVGGGAGGIELALAIHHRLTVVERIDNVDIKLISADPRLAVGHNDTARASLARELSDRGLDVYLSARVLSVQPGALETDADGMLAADEVLWVARAAPQPWPEAAGLTVDSAGFILVNESLQSVSDPNVFAAGDIATIEGHPRPTAGVIAVRQGSLLAANLKRVVSGLTLLRRPPQLNMLSLISTGERRAIASRGDYAARGRWAWYWKDRIDRRFVRRFRVSGVPRRAPRWHVSSPSGGELVAASGGELLARVLERAGVTPGAAVRRPVVNALEVQSIGGLRAPGDDPHHMGRIAAEHALNDIYALGGSPRTALGWVTVPSAGIDQMVGDLEQFVAGAMLAFEPAGVEWVGGHFVAGPDYCAGFAVTGTVHEDDLWAWQRIAIDDVLILTKSIGTGILLGADARAHCRGDWLLSVLDSMRASNLPALPVLRDAGVRAAAHVGEGGLLGQAIRMAQAARLCIEILPARVPLFDGVEACGSPDGRPASDRALSDIDRGPYAPEDIRVTSLLDPQLSGGLLAAVRPEQVVACIANLRTAGFRHAAIIGRVVAARDDGLACSLAEDPQH